MTSSTTTANETGISDNAILAIVGFGFLGGLLMIVIIVCALASGGSSGNNNSNNYF